MGKPIVVLAGGIGGAKFIEGLYNVCNPEDLHCIINTGDDKEFFGLYTSPDLDIVTYTLAGVIDKKKRWGYASEKFTTLSALSRFYSETWFGIGDKDLATHLYRTDMLRQGKTLTQVTTQITAAFGLKAHLYPMCDQPVPTMITTDEGVMDFETYYVQRRCRPKVLKITSENAINGQLNPNFENLLKKARDIYIAPSNPYVSIFPILSVPGMRDLLLQNRDKITAISPLICQKAIKGPLKEMMESLGTPPCCTGIADLYKDFIRNLIIDPLDENEVPNIEKRGIRAKSHPILLNTIVRKKKLARFLLEMQ
jgi:LPPG:FO 2-phospho-L-lactate transferase